MQLRGGFRMNSKYLAECPPILREYLGYMETVKGRSSNTVNGYFIDLRTFFRFLLIHKYISFFSSSVYIYFFVIDIKIAIGK